MTLRMTLASTLSAALLASAPLAPVTAAPAAGSGLRLTAPSLFTASAGTWVPVRAKIKNTTSRPARVTLKVDPLRGAQVSARSISVGTIAPGAVEVALVRIRAGRTQTSATLKAVSARATSASITVSIVGGFEL